MHDNSFKFKFYSCVMYPIIIIYIFSVYIRFTKKEIVEKEELDERL